MELICGDCLTKMKDMSDNSIDLLFCDLPYGQTNCKWDSVIDLVKFWKEVNRICKINCPMFFTCSTKFGNTLINSNPKNFRYDLIWIKSKPCSFLLAKKMPMKKHEMVYVFYRKLPYYNLSSHKHKFLKENSTVRTDGGCSSLYGDENKKVMFKDNNGKVRNTESRYDPPLPTSVVRETENYKNESELYGKVERKDYMRKNGESMYAPPLPHSVLEIKSEKGKHATQKPVALMKWILKYYSKEGDTILDPTMGSGSTGVACKEMKRNFIGIELDTEIFKVAVERNGG